MKYIHTIIYMTVSFILSSCIPKSSQEVRVAGNLREMMMDNVTTSNLDLRRLESYAHLYALGAMEDLAGEISIVDGIPLITRVVNDSIVNESTFEVNATLLVYTQVDRFRTMKINEELGLKELEGFLREVSESRELSQPFAFRVKGTASKIRWHVVERGSTSHEHASTSFNRTETDVEVELLGFYSDHHQGVFTHHGSNTHIHLVNMETGMTAHVHDVIIKADSKLLIPAQP